MADPLVEPITVEQAKDYLRILDDTSHDAKIEGMIPRAREWVEDHTGVVLVAREFTEYFSDWNALTIYRRPVTEVAITYGLSGAEDQTEFSSFSAALNQRPIRFASVSAWPELPAGNEISVTYTAGPAEDEALDERLLGAMYALIEGEFSEGYAYPEQAVAAAKRCCGQLRTPVIA